MHSFLLYIVTDFILCAIYFSRPCLVQEHCGIQQWTKQTKVSASLRLYFQWTYFIYCWFREAISGQCGISSQEDFHIYVWWQTDEFNLLSLTLINYIPPAIKQQHVSNMFVMHSSSCSLCLKFSSVPAKILVILQGSAQMSPSWCSLP